MGNVLAASKIFQIMTKPERDREAERKTLFLLMLE